MIVINVNSSCKPKVELWSTLRLRGEWKRERDKKLAHFFALVTRNAPFLLPNSRPTTSETARTDHCPLTNRAAHLVPAGHFNNGASLTRWLFLRRPPQTRAKRSARRLSMTTKTITSNTKTPTTTTTLATIANCEFH